MKVLDPTDLILKGLPYVVAVGTAVLSLWREVHKKKPEEHARPHARPDELAELRRKARAWGPLGLSGSILASLALITCVLGVWSTVRDALDRSADQAQINMLGGELGVANSRVMGLTGLVIELSGRVSGLGSQLSQADTELAKETRDSRKDILTADAQNAKELERAEDNTFVSVLSTAREPSEAVYDLELEEPVYTHGEFQTRSVATLRAEQFFPGWKIIQMLGPIGRYVDWDTLNPISFDVSLGQFKDVKGGEYRWEAFADALDRRHPERLQDGKPHARLGVRGRQHLVIRLPQFSNPDLVDLWNGPKKDNLLVELWVQLHGLDEEDKLRQAGREVDRLVRSASLYYTVSGKLSLCKTALLKPRVADLWKNQLHIKYATADKLENVTCPDYVADPASINVEPLDF